MESNELSFNNKEQISSNDLSSHKLMIPKLFYHKFPILNGKYIIINKIGEGISSNVYKAESMEHPGNYYAIKIYKENYINDAL